MPFKLSDHPDVESLQFLDNPSLSWRARGIMLALLQRPNRSATVRDLAAQSSDGITSIRSGLEEIIKVHYGYSYRNHGEHARIEQGTSSSRVGHVYVMRAKKNNLYKIGQTTDIAMRLCELSQLHGPIYVEWVSTTVEPNEHEGRLHALFATKRVDGEWFELNERDVEHIRSR